jgi:acyl dehydratase
MTAASGFDLEKVREEHVGRTIGSSRGRYPVEHDPIRRHCHMVGDTNPLFLDEEFARQGPYGAVICPPTLISYFAGNGAWPPSESRGTGGRPGFTMGVPTPGDRGINMGIVWEYGDVVRVGDRLSSQTSIVDIFVKPIRLDPEAVWIVTETRIAKEDDTMVALGRNTVLIHRSPEQVAAAEATVESAR